MKRFRTRRPTRRGATLVLVALLIAFIVGMCAFAIDLGYIMLVRTELQNAADSAALAGAGAMVQGQAEAEQEAIRFALLNDAPVRPLAAQNVALVFGEWDRDRREFSGGGAQPSALLVTVRSASQPFFFGRIFGQQSFTSEASAVATFQPRDIVLVLDYSGSMCFDSQFHSMSRLGRSSVEASLLTIYQELGSPTFGSMRWTPQYIASGRVSTVKSTLGLTRVAYPYPGGSWDEYISYVLSDNDVIRAGYHKKYGYLTWVNYLQSERGSHAETPALANTSEQPVTALKNATDVLLDELAENSPNDRVAVSIYTASDGTAILESALTHVYDDISAIVRARQAGHYQPYTNIYDGLRTGRLELEANARPGAKKVLVLMTDGQANRPSNSSTAVRRLREEAQICADHGLPIITIALGVDADTALMAEIANTTGGTYFEVPGGRSVSDYQADLIEVFRRIAADRSLQLVQ